MKIDNHQVNVLNWVHKTLKDMTYGDRLELLSKIYSMVYRYEQDYYNVDNNPEFLVNRSKK